MGYHVTILRTKDRHREPITLDETKKLITSMHGFKLQPSPLFKESFEISFSQSDGEKYVLLWQEGEIWTKNPDDKTMQVMLNLAKRLDARVRGDELETYITLNKTYQHPDDLAISASEQTTSKPKHKQWRLRDIPLVIFFIFAIPAVSFWKWLKKRK
ncbi:hypothetical protein KJ742_04080 [Patescibacteria group bacterium]|nr:hypothetical protein [Patescibacteria group bacterium]